MRLPSSKPEEIDPPTTSLGDIAFLLNIFFMITTTFAQQSSAKLQLPVAEHLETMPQNELNVSIDKDGVIALNGTAVQQVQDLRSLLEAQVKENTKIFFRCDREIPQRVFEGVLSEVTNAGGQLVLIGTKGMPE